MPVSRSKKGSPSGGDRDASAAESAVTVLRRLLSNIITLVQIRALRSSQEAKALAKEITRSAIFIGVAAVVSIYMIGLVLATAVLALSLVMKPWVAALAVFCATVLGIILLFLIGVWRLRARIRRLGGLIQAFKEDLRWLWTELFRSE